MSKEKPQPKNTEKQGLEMARQTLRRVKEMDLTPEEKERVMSMIKSAKEYEADRQLSKALNMYQELLRFLKSVEKKNKGIDYEKFKCLKTLEGHKDMVTSVVETSDGLSLISAGRYADVKIWNRITGECEKTFDDHLSIVRKVKLSKDGIHFYSVSNDGTIKMYALPIRQCLKTFDPQEEKQPVCSDVIEINDNILLGTYFSNEMRLWAKHGSETASSILELPKDITEVFNGIKISDQNTVALATNRGIVIFDLDTNEVVKRLNNMACEQSAVMESRDGRYLFVGAPLTAKGKEFDLQIWDKSDWTLVKSLKGHEDNIRSMAQTKDERHLVTCSDDKTVRVWELESDECIKVFDMKDHDPKDLILEDNGNIITAGRDKNIKIWGES